VLFPEFNAEITFLAGDCNSPMISPISSSLDLISTNADESIGLRFPRVSAIRDDKPVSDIDTIERVKELI